MTFEFVSLSFGRPRPRPSCAICWLEFIKLARPARGARPALGAHRPGPAPSASLPGLGGRTCRRRVAFVRNHAAGTRLPVGSRSAPLVVPRARCLSLTLALALFNVCKTMRAGHKTAGLISATVVALAASRSSSAFAFAFAFACASAPASPSLSSSLWSLSLSLASRATPVLAVAGRAQCWRSICSRVGALEPVRSSSVGSFFNRSPLAACELRARVSANKANPEHVHAARPARRRSSLFFVSRCARKPR